MSNKTEEIKARLRRFAFKAADFSENKNAKDVKQVEYVRLDMALLAIDELTKEGDYFTPDQIRKVQELAYEAGYNAGQGLKM